MTTGIRVLQRLGKASGTWTPDHAEPGTDRFQGWPGQGMAQVAHVRAAVGRVHEVSGLVHLSEKVSSCSAQAAPPASGPTRQLTCQPCAC